MDRHELAGMTGVTTYQGIAVGPALSDKEWRNILDEYLKTGAVMSGLDAYVRMTPRQKDIIQELKKAFKRIKQEA